MNAADLRSQLEEEMRWRTEEIFFFQNVASTIDPKDLDRYRRSLILILYAHFEGFCKFALVSYATAINEEGVSCFKVTSEIAAAALSDLFKGLRNPDSKSDFFRRAAPDDSKLHAFARDLEFVERAREIMRQVVSIPDSAVDTESNLKAVVLKKNFFRLGLPGDSIANHENEIGKLLAFRNKIAHGELKSGITAQVYVEVRDSALKVMNYVLTTVFDSFVGRSFSRKAVSRAAVA